MVGVWCCAVRAGGRACRYMSVSRCEEREELVVRVRYQHGEECQKGWNGTSTSQDCNQDLPFSVVCIKVSLVIIWSCHAGEFCCWMSSSLLPWDASRVLIPSFSSPMPGQRRLSLTPEIGDPGGGDHGGVHGRLYHPVLRPSIPFASPSSISFPHPPPCTWSSSFTPL